MDFVEGTDAAALIRQRYPHGMPPREVFDIIAAIGDALDYAHARYLLHRDVKPANILLSNTDSGSARRVLLADFGIARATNETRGLTATNVTVGSVAYAAPEQLTGQALDGRADQYALACTAFYLLTGRVPFADSNPAVVIGNHLSSTPPLLADVRPDLARLDTVLSKALAKEPFERYDTCREFAAALSQAGESLLAATDATQPAPVQPAPATTAPPPPTAPAAGASSKKTALIVAGTAVGLLAVGVVAFFGARLAQSPTAPTAVPPPSTPTDIWGESANPPRTITETAPPVTVTKPVAPPPTSVRPPAAPAGDLGLRQPISRPRCNGQGIVILGSVTTPGLYPAGVQRLLDANPGSFYLRTDQSCPSLRQATEEGDPIYAVFRLAGTTSSQVCDAVHAAGGMAYGKWLDYQTDPGYIIPC
jgi:serine/threonine-protein kinase